MTAVHPRGVALPAGLSIALLLPMASAARPKTSADVPPPPGPRILLLDAVPAPDLTSVTARAVIRTEGLDGPATVSLAVGASTAWTRVEPDSGDVTVERNIPLTRAKPWTPVRPVRFLLIVSLTKASVPLDRRGIRFAMRTLHLADGRLLLNGSPFQVRGIASRPGRTSPGDLKALRAAGYNAILLPASDRTSAAHDACDGAGLLALDEVPVPGPALVHLRPGTSPAAEAMSLAIFGTATAFTEAARERLAEHVEIQLARVRREPAHPGFLLDADPPPDLAGRYGERSLSIEPPPQLVDAGSGTSATITLGAGPWPRDTVLEWRPGTEDGWRPVTRGTVGARATRLLSLPPTERPGRISIAVRARSSRRTLAEVTAGWRMADLREASQYSFALAGDAPGIRATYGSWIIPPELAPVIVVSHPARLSGDELSGVFRWMARGKRLLFLGLDQTDVDILSRHPEGCWTLRPESLDPEGPSHLTWIRPDRFGARLPATGITEPGRWFAGPPYAPLLPILSLQPLSGATVWAGDAPLLTDGFPLASVMAATAGEGRAVFCQWRVDETLPAPLARRVFERLLGL